MTDSTATYLESAERLCDTLERIGDALVTLDTKTLIETAETLSQLLTALGSPGTSGNKAEIEALVRRGRTALMRCRRLGTSFNDVATVRLQLCTGIGGYGSDGAHIEADAAPTLKATA